MENRMFRI